jgi:hypothetical protein
MRDNRIERGDRITVKHRTGSYSGVVDSATNWGTQDAENWYVEFTDDRGGAHYWKQQIDGGKYSVEKAQPQAEPQQAEDSTEDQKAEEVQYCCFDAEEAKCHPVDCPNGCMVGKEADVTGPITLYRIEKTGERINLCDTHKAGYTGKLVRLYGPFAGLCDMCGGVI